MILKEGQKYLLNTDNEHLNGATAVVTAVHEAYADVDWTRGNKKGSYRALPSELSPIQTPKQLGFTGNVCPHCYGQKLIRAGACEICTECGASSGCG